MTYVFVGSYSEAPNIKLTRFGQRVELPPELAEETAHDGGLPCIPAEAFDALLKDTGIDDKALAKWGAAALSGNTPKAAGADFKSQFDSLVKKSRVALHEIREVHREGFRTAFLASVEAARAAEQPREEMD